MSTSPISPEDKARIDNLLDHAITDVFDRIDIIQRGKYTVDTVARHLDRNWGLGDMYHDWMEEGEE